MADTIDIKEAGERERQRKKENFLSSKQPYSFKALKTIGLCLKAIYYFTRMGANAMNNLWKLLQFLFLSLVYKNRVN
jgi:hypothetical protein